MIPSSAAAFTVVSPADTTDITFVTVRLNSVAHPLLPMPAGTVVSADALSSACKIGKISPTVVPNTAPGTPTSQLGSTHSIGLTGCGGSTIVITATSPSGVISTFSYLVPETYVAPPPAPDTTPPVLLAVPAVEGITATGVTLTAMINEAGTGYYKVVDNGVATTPRNQALAPSVAGVLLAGNTFPMAANTPSGKNLTGLTTGRSYTIYFVAKDSLGNTQALVTFVTFDTL